MDDIILKKFYHHMLRLYIDYNLSNDAQLLAMSDDAIELLIEKTLNEFVCVDKLSHFIKTFVEEDLNFVHNIYLIKDKNI